MKIKILKSEQLKTLPRVDELGFGNHFTDHMFNMDYSRENGWHHPRIEPYESISMDPAAMVLHYAQEVFEGLKAYRRPSGELQLFRPMENLKRLNRSCRRMCIPEFDAAAALAALKALVRTEAHWVPSAPGTSLYIRPNIIAMDPFLGVRSSRTFRFYIILSPVGAYFANGFNPVKICVAEDHVRAVRGGVGAAKTAGNYAASLLASDMARKEGYNQVLWLDGVDRKYIEEVGAMNIFFRINDEIVTPALNGSILPGITRDSVITLLRSWGLPVAERKLSIEEVVSAHGYGHLQEIFGAGTAAVISPVGTLKYGDQVMTVGKGTVGPVARRLYQALNDIQYGPADDPWGWIEPVNG